MGLRYSLAGKQIPHMNPLWNGGGPQEYKESIIIWEATWKKGLAHIQKPSLNKRGGDEKKRQKRGPEMEKEERWWEEMEAGGRRFI